MAVIGALSLIIIMQNRPDASDASARHVTKLAAGYEFYAKKILYYRVLLLGNWCIVVIDVRRRGCTMHGTRCTHKYAGGAC